MKSAAKKLAENTDADHFFTALPGLHAWPTPLPDDWLIRVHRPQTEADLAALRRSLARGQRCGSEDWQERVSTGLNDRA